MFKEMGIKAKDVVFENRYKNTNATVRDLLPAILKDDNASMPRH